MDNIKFIKLTPSAKSAFEEIKDEIANKILDESYKIAHLKNTSNEEISLSDLIQARESIFFEKNLIEKKIDQRKRFNLIISMSGILYAVLGIIFYLYQNIELFTIDNVGLMAALVGISITAFSFFYNQLLKNKISQYSEIRYAVNEFEIVRRWQAIEKAGSELMEKSGNNIDKSKSIGNLLNYLSNTVLNPDEASQLKELLTARNNIVHANSTFSKYEIGELIKKADGIIEKIEAMY